MRFRPGILVATFALSACAPRLAREVVALRPSYAVQAPRLQVVAASAARAPAWLADVPPPRADAIAFVGRAAGSTQEEARAAAAENLLETVNAYVGVAVQSSVEVVQEEQRSGDGRGAGTQTVRAERRTDAAATLARVQPVDAYWERLAERTPSGNATRWRYSLLAWVPREAVERARLERANAAPAPRVVIGSVEAGAGCPLGRALAADLALRLAAAGVQVVAGPELAGSGGPVVRGECKAEGQTLRLAWTLAGSDGAVRGGAVKRPAGELFRLEDDFAAAVARALEEAQGRGR